MRVFKIIALFIVVLTLLGSQCSTCEDVRALCFRNHTDSRVFYWFAHWNMPNWTLYHYPNTVLPDKRPADISSIMERGRKSCRSVGSPRPPGWITIFSWLPAGKFSIYFFTENPNTQEKWDYIRANNLYYRKDLTLQELISNDFVIDFP